MGFFKRIFGFLSRPDSEASRTTPQPVAKPLPVEPPVRSVLVSWHEMLDAHARIAGYFLPASPVSAGSVITGQQLLDAFRSENVTRLAEKRLVVMPVTIEQWQGADFGCLATARTYFHLLLASVAAPDAWYAVARDIRACGARVAVDAAFFDLPDASGDLADMVLLDARAGELAALEQMVKAVRQRYPRLPVVVRDVSSWAEFRFFQSLGVDYCTGGFAATPDEAEQAGRLSQSRLVVIEMLNQLRSDAEPAVVAATAKRDPAVVLKLLEMANSPLSGLSRRVSNLEEAIMLLGRDAVYRWLTLAMFRIDAQRGLDETLLVIALSRACCLEALAPGGDKKLAGELFLLGMLSVVDSLLGMPMAAVLGRMHLPEAVSMALLRNEGPYVRYLVLMIALERCRIDQAVTMAGLMAIDPTRLLNTYSTAMAWATSDLLG
ncbi:EAL and HDOD domain-containing protein [Quatrionicoccus australiensis]|uniref:EAL and HDOD domain-containing protein n=1 Tax=Quatrionicoccus australiensis TaxID=138118 RepID=UPI001CF93118|nr:HDOD domain-containing protein [Quatrionicoccus australiensis]MCB4358097.1 HDOD domain-containing protein [Quatrionicoccus australiensis]